MITGLTFVLLLTAANAPSDKLDVGLADSTGKRPVFVRMEDQIFKKAGDFEKFCTEHELTPRRDNRKYMLDHLHLNAESSWSKIQSTVRDLTAASHLSDVKQFWIVNGFACDADAEACKALAARPDVSFVYLQRGPNGLRQNVTRNRRASDDANKEAALKKRAVSSTNDQNVPFSTEGLEVAWDIKQIQADQVWNQEKVTGKGTIVAINDQGIYDLPCFEHALWQNSKETVNGKDDDNNGYIDDIFGWDSAADNGQVLGNSGVSHGTMCSGIVGGRPTAERKQVTGVAPRTQLMIVNGMGYLSTFEYALTNHADVFSMSYMFVNMELGNYRGVFRLAAEHMTAAGVLLCGGAGNFAKTAPEGQQITLPKDIPCVVAAAGTNESGARPEFSSRGPVTWTGVKFYDDFPADKPLGKPDVSAPATGFACWGWSEDLRPAWQTIFKGSKDDVLVMGPQGNSFAGPHVAGVAALMFSRNPLINAWQVKRIIEETCKDIGPTGRDFDHGAGIIQALAAVRRVKV